MMTITTMMMNLYFCEQTSPDNQLTSGQLSTEHVEAFASVQAGILQRHVCHFQSAAATLASTKKPKLYGSTSYAVSQSDDTFFHFD